MLGERATVEKLGPDALKAYHAKFMDPSQMVLAVVGDVRASELLTHIRDVFDARAGESHVALELDLADDPLVEADFDRIEQVLGNLIDNALRHAPAGSRVHAGARRATGAFAELYVSDEGPGIAAADLPHVFERFYRSKDEASGSGTGLGLAIAREIVRAHGGELRAESPSAGGATFTFTLPLAGHGSSQARAMPPHASQGRGAQPLSETGS
jgi:signal transduction histidine kinase